MEECPTDCERKGRSRIESLKNCQSSINCSRGKRRFIGNYCIDAEYRKTERFSRQSCMALFDISSYRWGAKIPYLLFFSPIKMTVKLPDDWWKLISMSVYVLYRIYPAIERTDSVLDENGIMCYGEHEEDGYWSQVNVWQAIIPQKAVNRVSIPSAMRRKFLMVHEKVMEYLTDTCQNAWSQGGLSQWQSAEWLRSGAHALMICQDRHHVFMDLKWIKLVQ